MFRKNQTSIEVSYSVTTTSWRDQLQTYFLIFFLHFQDNQPVSSNFRHQHKIFCVRSVQLRLTVKFRRSEIGNRQSGFGQLARKLCKVGTINFKPLPLCCPTILQLQLTLVYRVVKGKFILPLVQCVKLWRGLDSGQGLDLLASHQYLVVSHHLQLFFVAQPVQWPAPYTSHTVHSSTAIGEDLNAFQTTGSVPPLNVQPLWEPSTVSIDMILFLAWI